MGIVTRLSHRWAFSIFTLFPPPDERLRAAKR
jgi:hypothetical protein